MLRLSILLFCFISSIYSIAWAEQAASRSETENLRYVSDVLVINIKDQLEKPYSVVGVVRSNDPVHIIEEQENYYKIETSNKKQGWIAKQFLKNQPPDAIIVEQLKQEIVELKKQLAVTPLTGTEPSKESEKISENSCADLQQKLGDAEKQIKQLLAQKEQKAPSIAGPLPDSTSQLQDQYSEISKQLEQTSQRYNLLVSEYEKRGKEIALLHNSMAKQDDTTRFFWFGAGAAVFFIGLLAGRSANRKKNKFMY